MALLRQAPMRPIAGDPTRAVRWSAALAAVLAFCGCAALVEPSLPAARDWADGPVRWLLLPDERAELSRVGTPASFSAFVSAFWRRRAAAHPGLDLARTFQERVMAADRLYAEPGHRGSLSDRGAVLVLFGPPPLLRSRRVKVPAVGGSPGGPGRPTRWVPLEEWVYARGELGPFASLTSEDEPLVFGFVEEGGRVRLQGSRAPLEAAARVVAGLEP